MAGQQKGLEKGSGTRSAILWYTEEAIKIKRPKYLLMENVAALVTSKFIQFFNEWCALLESYGYKNFSQVLDASDYGVAQHRERIFVVSILDEDARFYFPKPFELTKCIDDYLEKDVPENYFLDQERVNSLVENVVSGSTNDSKNEQYEEKDIAIW